MQYADSIQYSKEEPQSMIIKRWVHSDPEHGLHTPLKDWPAEWTHGKNRIFVVKWGQRADIALEFLNVYVVFIIHTT
jgi:hypothetical protein